jgi:phage-related protein
MVVPEIVKQVIVIVMILQFVPNLVGPVTELFLAFAATICAALRKVRAHLTAVIDPRRLAITSILNSVLPIVRSEVSLIASIVAAIGAIVCPVAHAISSIVGDITTSLRLGSRTGLGSPAAL